MDPLAALMPWSATVRYPGHNAIWMGTNFFTNLSTVRIVYIIFTEADLCCILACTAWPMSREKQSVFVSIGIRKWYAPISIFILSWQLLIWRPQSIQSKSGITAWLSFLLNSWADQASPYFDILQNSSNAHTLDDKLQCNKRISLRIYVAKQYWLICFTVRTVLAGRRRVSVHWKRCIGKNGRLGAMDNVMMLLDHTFHWRWSYMQHFRCRARI